MKFAALISGGKDSIFNIIECLNQGHELVALLNLYPSPQCGKDEIDSYMYQSVGHETLQCISEAIGNVPLYRSEIFGMAVSTGLQYCSLKRNLNDEVEDLFNLISRVKQDFPTLQGISSGAILSNYQRSRVENVCSRLKLTSLAFMWQRSQIELLQTILKCKVNPILIKIAALGLDDKHLGKPLKLVASDIISKSEQYGLNPCGEGGEYETITLDAPFFQKRIEIDSSHVVTLVESDIAAVKYVKIDSLRLIEKHPHEYKRSDVFYGSDLCTEFNLAVQTDIIKLKDELSSEINEINDQLMFPTNGKTCNKLELKILTAHVHLCNEKHSDLATTDAIRNAINRIRVQISELGNCTEHDWLYSVLCVPNMELMGLVETEYSRYFTIDKLPGLTCIETVGNSMTLYSVVIERGLATISNLYFQSLSHWVPPCTGPYSQSVTVRSLADGGDSLCFVSGQVAMHPENLCIINQHDVDVGSESWLGLRHITRLVWTQSQLGWAHLQSMICYCVSEDALVPCRVAFHDVVCAVFSHFKGECLCRRVEYVAVRALPHRARVQWQAVFSTRPTDFCSGPVIVFSTEIAATQTSQENTNVPIDAYLEGDLILDYGSIAIGL